MLLADNTATILSVGTPIAVAALGAFLFVVRLMIQAALTQRTDDDEDHDSDRTDDLISNLEKRIDEQAVEIRDLREELRVERRAREQSEQRHQRELNELGEKLQSAETRLGIARTHIKSLEDKA